MIRVRAPSRLHFGLLSLTTSETDPAGDGPPVRAQRCFGGVGLMVEKPGVSVHVEPAASWSSEGPLAERALLFAQRFIDQVSGRLLPPQRIIVENASPEHVGLGTGSQLALSVARALAELAGLKGLTSVELARFLGRGQRSGIGLHGFHRGGFLVDGGKRAAQGIAPLTARLDFPEAWRVLLVYPAVPLGLHGQPEQEAFSHLQDLTGGPERTDALCRLVLLGMLPALVEQDLDVFGDTLFEFNARAGEPFAHIQGGLYGGARAAEFITFLRQAGFRGVGQSSWGPAVFAVAGDEAQAQCGRQGLEKRFGPEAGTILITRGCNGGAIVERP